MVVRRCKATSSAAATAAESAKAALALAVSFISTRILRSAQVPFINSMKRTFTLPIKSLLAQLRFGFMTWQLCAAEHKECLVPDHALSSLFSNVFRVSFEQETWYCHVDICFDFIRYMDCCIPNFSCLTEVVTEIKTLN